MLVPFVYNSFPSRVRLYQKHPFAFNRALEHLA